MNVHYSDMLRALSEEGAEFLLVGAYALSVHGVTRATQDLDLWVRPSPENAPRVRRALARYGAPVGDLPEGDLARPDFVYQIGVAPLRVDILTSLTGLDFEEAWTRRVETTYEGLRVPVIGREDLLANKTALSRPQDLADISRLRASEEAP